MVILEELQALPTNERLELAMNLWESVETDAQNSIKLDQAQLAEIDYRLDLFEANPKQGTPWPIVRDRILATL